MQKQKGILQTCLSVAWGGLEMVAFECAVKIRSQGCHVTTVCLKDSALLQKCREAGLDTLEVERPNIYFSPRCTAVLRKALKSGRYHGVLIQQMNELWQVVPALRGMKDISLSGVSHTFLKFNKKDLLHRWLYNRLNTMIALTEIQKENLLKYLPLRESNVAIMPNAVDLEKFNPRHRDESLRAELMQGADGLLIGVIARLDPKKGALDVIQIAQRLRELGVSFRIVMVGDEPIGEPGMKATLEKQIHELKLGNNVHLIGHRSDIARVTASLDVLLMPSKFETFGRVLIEAMASGVAIVASGGGGVPSIVHNEKNGLCTPPASVEDMAQSIAVYARDPEKRRRFAASGLQDAVERYDYHKVDRQLYSILNLV